mmetsp:Transcript_10073/g.41578  ORF Transcript_10073/g.41578 Transcript_10073/m.41578 type:complete len:230 (-) Transcript_10073:703-1392(-)
MHSSRNFPFAASSSASCSVIASEASAASRSPARRRSDRSSRDSSDAFSRDAASIRALAARSSSSASRTRDLAEDASPTAIDATSRADGVAGAATPAALTSPPRVEENPRPAFTRSRSRAPIAAAAAVSDSATLFRSCEISFSARLDAAISPVSAESSELSRDSLLSMFAAALAAIAASGCVDRISSSSMRPGPDLACGLSIASMSVSASSPEKGARISSASSAAATSAA